MGSSREAEAGVKRRRRPSNTKANPKRKRTKSRISAEKLLLKAKKAPLPVLFVANSDAPANRACAGPTPNLVDSTPRSRPTPGRRVEVWLEGLQSWAQATIRPFTKKDPKATQILVEFDVGGMELLSSGSQWRFKA